MSNSDSARSNSGGFRILPDFAATVEGSRPLDEAQYRSFIENLPILFYAVQPTPPYSPVYVSPSFSRFGYPLEIWLNDPRIWEKVIHHGDRRRIFDSTEQSTVTGEEVDYEYRIVASDGTEHWVRDRGCLIRNEAGEVVLREGVILDITERKRAEEDLRESEERYRTLFENANDIFYVHDLDGNYISLNRAAERVFGYTREEALGMHISQIAAPEQFGLVRQKLAEKLVGGVDQTIYEVESLKKDGTRMTLEVNSTVITKGGKPVAVQGIARDITERKRSEAALRESEANLAAAQRITHLGSWELEITNVEDWSDNAVRWSDEVYRIFGYEPGQFRVTCPLIGESIHIDDRRFVTEKLAEAVSENKFLDVELRVVLPDGSERLAHAQAETVYDASVDRVVKLVGTIQDITERRKSEEALKTSEERYRDLFENANDLIYTHDLDGYFTSLNRAGERITGYTRGEALKMRVSDVVAPEHLDLAREMTFRKLKGDSTPSYELELIARDGSRVMLEINTRLMMQDGRPVGVQGIARDITSRRHAEDRLRHHARHDALTNLPNRTEFMKHLQAAVSRAASQSDYRFAVLFLDLDRFKVINDSLGHVIGDKLLVGIAKRLESCLRPGDTVARLGGDEFTILLQRVNVPDDAIIVANRLQARLAEPFKFDNYEVFTSASIGIIVSDEITREAEDFLRDADTAMYRAKENGKARSEVFDREMHVRNMNLLRVETDLRHAVEREEFELYYQPIVDLETGEIAEFEALIRWRHPAHGIVSPNEFIGVAEETGLIIPIGRWILAEACQQIKTWQNTFSRPLSISVNLSAKQLMHPAFTEEIKAIILKAGLRPQQLKLEVTESTVMENSELALSVLCELHGLGISLSTDDFGTGYSSLSYLQRFPFDRLKIDRSFIDKMTQDKKSEAIVKTILMLGDNLDIEVVAEGIETLDQHDALRNLGCKFGQGFLFSRPLGAVTAEKLLEKAGESEMFAGAALSNTAPEIPSLQPIG